MKTGVFTGSYATNPVTGMDVPIWIADYVLMGYGTGAIMAVPSGDQRDFEFARMFGLDIPAIQRPPDEWFAARAFDPNRWPEAFVGNPYVNSANASLDLNGLASVADGVAATNGWLEAHDHGESTVTYKLRDWLFSRQRYWGEPFHPTPPATRTVPDVMLPVELPETESSAVHVRPRRRVLRAREPARPTGRLDRGHPRPGRGRAAVSPRQQRHAAVGGLVLVRASLLRPRQPRAVRRPGAERYWMGPWTELRPDHPGGVDLYVGGVEHAVLHLLRRALLAQGAVRPRASVVARAVRPPVQPGLHPRRGVHGRARPLRRGGRRRRPSRAARSPTRGGPSPASGGRWARA